MHDDRGREAERLRALARYTVVDSGPEDAFDELAKLAALACDAPVALISLIDRDRQWFKARVGFDARETPRANAICDHTIRGREMFVVEDTAADPRFATSPLVAGGPRIRFYAGAPLLAPDGHAIGTLAVADGAPRQLSSERRAALQALARQVVAQLELRRCALDAKRATDTASERFELFMRATNDVVYDWDVRTNDLWFSEGLARTYGTSDADATYAGWIARVHPDDVERIESSLNAFLAGTETGWQSEYGFRRGDGTYAHVLDRGYAMRDDAGKPLRLVGAMIDLSQRLELEDQVIRAQRMQAIGQLAGGVAHDFNNILTVVECNAFLLQRDASDADRREHIDEILHAVDRAASLTRQLLLVSRKQPMRRVPVNLADVVNSMSQMLRRVIGDHIELQVAIEDPALPAVLADVSMIEQVVLNLAVNARDAMTRGGTLRIETRAAHLAAPQKLWGIDLPAGSYATLRVEDTGVGIPPEVLPRIFEAFFTTKELAKGTGLGLSTVFGIVRQHQGAIDVRSALGTGTTFVVYLPAVPARAEPVHTPAPRPHVPHGSETILVVEDEPVVRSGLCSLLEQFGYTVLAAPSAVTALEIWERHRKSIELVVTDLMMPGGLSGRDLAERLLAERPDLPIIYSSGYSDQFADQGEPLVEGENFLEKPYTPARLAQLVRTRLDRRQTAPR
jgi:hypothetical protein